MNAQKVIDLKHGSQTLWEFLASLPTSWEAQLMYAIILGGVIGMVGNYTRKFLQNETAGWCFIRYLVDEHPRRTILAMFSIWGTGMAGITMGVFETADGQFVGWFNVMWIAITNGFMFDAVTNRAADKPALS